MTKKKWLTIVIVVLSSIFIFVMLYAVGCRVGCKGIRCKSSLNNARSIEFTDTITGQTYGGDARFPYDGLEHKFSYRLIRLRDKKELDSGWVQNNGKAVKERGDYYLTVVTSYKGKTEKYEFRIHVEGFYPEMKFEPNGAIEYEDGKYYKYKYTGEACLPKAYAEYEGKFVGYAYKRNCEIWKQNKYVAVREPIELGRYSCLFATSDLSSTNLYERVHKVITIEIVE